MGAGTQPESERPVVWGVIVVAITVATLVAVTAVATSDSDEDGRAEVGSTSTTDATTSSTTPTSPRVAEPSTAESVVALMNDYDVLYAQIVASREVLYDPTDPLHERIATLLTPDSPLSPTYIYGGDASFGTPEEYRAIQVPGGQGTNPSALEPGERYAKVPIFHEVLAQPPESVSSGTLPVCVHLDWIIRPEGDKPPWIQGVSDAEVDGEIDLRRIDGTWRLHDWLPTSQLFGTNLEGRCAARCGPDPELTAIGHQRPQPASGDAGGDGFKDWAAGPAPTDAPCPD